MCHHLLLAFCCPSDSHAGSDGINWASLVGVHVHLSHWRWALSEILCHNGKMSILSENDHWQWQLASSSTFCQGQKNRSAWEKKTFGGQNGSSWNFWLWDGTTVRSCVRLLWPLSHRIIKNQRSQKYSEGNQSSPSSYPCHRHRHRHLHHNIHPHYLDQFHQQ